MIKNYAKFDYFTISMLFDVNNLKNIGPEWISYGISTDSRDIEAGNLFIGLKGNTFDGNEKAVESIHKGASAAVIDTDYYEKNISAFDNIPVIIVESSIKALGMLANHHRRQYNYPVIAIGGSNGKTTTKEFTASLLSKKYRVLKTQSNYNNQVGVPLTLLQMNDEYDVAVIETGTNEPGEIAVLSAMVEPTHGLLTNIGREHLEKLIDLDGVEFEETFLFGYLKKHNGFAFVNFDDDRLRKYYNFIDNKISYGVNPDSIIKVEINLNSNLNPSIKIKYDDRIIQADLKTTGYVTGLNALAAVAVGFHFCLNDEEIKDGLESYKPDDSHGYGRMLLQRINEIILINDCYNANPDSMKAGLDSLMTLSTKGKKFPVLGDMRELGEASDTEHLQILEYAAKNFNEVFVTGTEMKKAANKLKMENIWHFTEKEVLANFLSESAKQGDVIVIKGSRGMSMEKIIFLFFENIKK